MRERRTAATVARVFFLFALVFSASAAPPEFDKLIAFAGRDHVRIAASYDSGDATGGVEFRGKITGATNQTILWQGSLGTLAAGAKAHSLSNTISGLKPELWSPVSPTLYLLEVSALRDGKTIATKKVRFGFRSFEIKDGQFHLNGQPIFLRGVAINPPGRGVPDEVGLSRKFAEDYVRFLKSQNLNIFRLSIDESQVWFDVCDELGMMLYAGRYGAPIASEPLTNAVDRGFEPEETGKRVPPQDFAASMAGYKDLFGRFASHPSIVEYYLSNELPTAGTRGKAFSEYLERACAELKQWDPTRPYIGNAGYGEGREGDVCDVHRYWGWYYNSFLTYYNLRDKLYPKPLFGDPVKNQPLTFTECVGSFTGSSGEFNVVRVKQLAPRLGWIGHTETPREDALAYQSFMTQQACESFRRMRPLNPRLAGLMPFTILFYNWSGIASFDEMKAKPVMAAMRTAYQPVLLSWENWTSQLYAGQELRPIAHVINDDDHKGELRKATLEYSLRGKDGKEFASGKATLPNIAYFGTWKKALSLKIPSNLPTGEYLLTGSVMVSGEVRSTNYAPVFVAGSDWAKQHARPEQSVHLFDPAGDASGALKKLGIAAERVSNLSDLPKTVRALVIGENANLNQHAESLRRFVREGGRVLWLQPDVKAGDWLPNRILSFASSPNDVDYPPKTRPFREQMNVNLERPNHPVFQGLNRRRFSFWSDYSSWDQTKPGFPKVYPVSMGFKLEEPSALANTAILADYDRGLEGIALCEMFDGKGSVIVSAFDLLNRVGLDPVADRLLVNLVAYIASKAPHEVHPLIEQPIRWGDFPSERGVAAGSMNGLLVNAEWVASLANPNATPMPPNTGAWNMLPGEQFQPRGRNPYGPYTYSTASSLRNGTPDATTGEGFFWARVPAGKKFVVTTAKNPGTNTVTLRVAVNDQPTASTQIIAPGKTEKIRTPFEAESSNVRIRYAGEKNLVLLETAFE